MTVTFKTVIIKLDILSTSPKLKIYEEDSYKTILGGLLSIAVTILTIASVVYFGKDIITKKDPVSIVSAYEFTDVAFDMSVDNYYIYLGVQDSKYKLYNDPTIFNFTAYHKTIILYPNGDVEEKYSDIEIKPCSYYYDNSTILKEGLDKDIFFCLKPSQLKVEGFWGNSINSFFGIGLYRCINSTQNSNNCKPTQEIESKLNGGIISLFSKNYLLDLKDLDNPAKLIYDDIYYSLNSDFTFSLFIQLRKMDISTDNGFILENISYDNKFYADQPHILYYGRRGDLLADIVIQSKSIGRQIKRSYIKFQDFLTKMGGLIKAFVMISGFIINFTSDVEFYHDFIYKTLKKMTISKETSKLRSDTSNFYIGNMTSRHMSSMSKTQFHRITKINNFQQTNAKSFNCETDNSVLNALKIQFSYSKPYNIINQVCLSQKENLISKIKNNLKRRFNKVLSIENIFEKTYMIEALIEVVFNDKQISNVENSYMEKFFNVDNNSANTHHYSNSIFYINKKFNNS